MFLKPSFIAAFIVLFMSASTLKAQFGVRAGINLANQTFKIDGLSVTPESIIGLNAALFYNVSLSNNLVLQPELSFSQKGSKFDETFLGEEIKSTINYLEIPVLLKYKSNSERIGFFGQAGPALGFALSGKTTVGDESASIDFEEDGLRRTDLGFHLGAGVSFGKFLVDARYMLGVANLSDAEEGTTRNRGFMLSLGFMF
jgi:hypothetical protein